MLNNDYWHVYISMFLYVKLEKKIEDSSLRAKNLWKTLASYVRKQGQVINQPAIQIIVNCSCKNISIEKLNVSQKFLEN